MTRNTGTPDSRMKFSSDSDRFTADTGDTLSHRMHAHRVRDCKRRHRCCGGMMQVQVALIIFIMLEIGLNVGLVVYSATKKGTSMTFEESVRSGVRRISNRRLPMHPFDWSELSARAQRVLAGVAVVITVPLAFCLLAYLMALCGFCFKQPWIVVPLMMLKAMVTLILLYLIIALITMFTVQYLELTDDSGGRRIPSLSHYRSALKETLIEEYLKLTAVFLVHCLLSMGVFIFALRTYQYYSERKHHGDCDGFYNV